jgi:hypothetical protein
MGALLWPLSTPQTYVNVQSAQELSHAVNNCESRNLHDYIRDAKS